MASCQEGPRTEHVIGLHRLEPLNKAVNFGIVLRDRTALIALTSKSPMAMSGYVGLT